MLFYIILYYYIYIFYVYFMFDYSRCTLTCTLTCDTRVFNIRVSIVLAREMHDN